MRLTMLFAIYLTLTIAGCANNPPSCDGSDRRPVNQPSQAGVTHPGCNLSTNA